MNFKQNFDLEKRREMYQKESYMHPNKIAVVVEVHPKSAIKVNRVLK